MSKVLTPSEKRILKVFWVVLAVGGLWTGVNWSRSKVLALQQEEKKLLAELAASRQWIEERKLWEERAAWLKENQPVLKNTGEERALMADLIQSSAKKNQLTIVTQAWADTKPNPRYQELSLKLTMTGSLEAFSKWITEFQRPENFYLFKSFNLKSAAEPPTVQCEMEVSRYFAPTGPSQP